MCGWTEAFTGASFAIGAAQGIAKYGAASADADATLKYQAQERYNAEYDRNQKYNQIGLRQQQEVDAASQSLFDNEIRAVKARAVADASAADSGVSGNSVEAVARDVYAQQGRIDASTTRNNKMSVAQLQTEKEAANTQYLSRINQPAVKQPSMLGLGLDIAGAGVQAYDLYSRRKDGSILNRAKA
jgi:hypothetical protein